MGGAAARRGSGDGSADRGRQHSGVGTGLEAPDATLASGWADHDPTARKKQATWTNEILELGSGFVMGR